jgi:hypothetical protein
MKGRESQEERRRERKNVTILKNPRGPEGRQRRKRIDEDGTLVKTQARPGIDGVGVTTNHLVKGEGTVEVGVEMIGVIIRFKYVNMNREQEKGN